MLKQYLFVLLFAALFACNPGDSNNSSEELMTDSGYTYIFHKDASGPAAKVGQQSIFDIDMHDDTDKLIKSMRNAPARPNAMIPPVTPGEKPNPIMDVLRIMGPGDSLSVIVPSDSIAMPAPGFEKSSYIKYIVTVKEVMSQADFQARVEQDTKETEAKMDIVKEQEKEKLQEYGQYLNAYKAGEYDGKMEDLGDGLQMYVIEEGSGKVIEAGQLAEIHYFGYMMGGRCFDNSFKYGRPYGVNVGRNSVIQGWERALLEMKKGTKALVIIPPELAYGEQGTKTIPGNSTLAFYMDVTDVYY